MVSSHWQRASYRVVNVRQAFSVCFQADKYCTSNVHKFERIFIVLTLWSCEDRSGSKNNAYDMTTCLMLTLENLKIHCTFRNAHRK